MSSLSSSSTPRLMRHEEGADVIPETRGWLRKEGETLHNLYKRYMVLKGCTFSNHRNEDGPATWTVDMTQASVRVGPRKNEVVLSLPQKRISLFAADDADQARWVAAMKVAIAGGRSVDTYYKLGRLLGEGAFAQVRLAADRETGEHVAIKVIKKSEFAPQEMEYIRREVQVCRQVYHSNIIETRDIFDTSAELFIVLELLSGGELFDQIAEAGSFTEKQAAQVMREITKGVAYLHKSNICHGDLKPENILTKSKKWPLDVKLCDFGLANFVQDDAASEEQLEMVAEKAQAGKGAVAGYVGTPGYVAPEIVKREPYGPAVDMWACGVVLYIMLSGKMPFFGRNDAECLKRTAEGKYSFPAREWSRISPEAVSLVKALLQVDPSKRLTANAALAHTWLADPDAVADTPIEDLAGIHSRKRKLRKAFTAAVTIGRLNNLMNLSGGVDGTSSSSADGVSVGQATAVAATVEGKDDVANVAAALADASVSK
ncbi:hypothetical protein BU14_0672s0009 [Porphyra umbilicalis]|uniref:Protein kinase domain-containing protein n=1 Tax=Porphyra umbilicalis TaxID=2786 RepID=A0A1X6NQH3_PORUM|nr:hypothetical protein BU14_0672s0009 [Porphyra umbilicalis]|eukprot:OSX70770.1 hypothetical protein BU14_0672s0009 [Porphyra umbilicalis]